MRQYHDLLTRILESGVRKDDRTGTGTLSVFGHQMRFNLAVGFPLVTTKKIHMKSVVHELLWMLRGETNVRSLQAAGVTIWDEWARPDGELGPVYGHAWRSWPSRKMTGWQGDMDLVKIDQIANAIRLLRTNPDSRRILVSAWNPDEVDEAALPPCHVLFQFYTSPGISGGRRRLSCQLYQRSADVMLGVPFNIASYALLTMMVAKVVDMTPGEFIWTGGDCHLYLNHVDQARIQMVRDPRPLPQMLIRQGVKEIDDFRYDDFALDGYDPHPHIAAAVSV